MSDAREDPPPPPERPDPSDPHRAWSAARAAARRLLSPVERFLSIEASSGILLLAATLAALAWANSRWRGAYARLLHAPVPLRVGRLAFERDVQFWINDGLMVVFFFVVGLEIKRELRTGELRDWRRAALPALAALGGMLVPAGLYLLVNVGTPAARGWGVPTATDIAFAVGILALLGRRVPPALRVMLLALAVIDDLGAIVVIAVFYSSGISLAGLAFGTGGLVIILLLRRLGLRSPWAYLPPAVLLWAGTYASGVHPTIAGVVLGICTPVAGRADQQAPSPADRLLRALHGPVAFAIMPAFALANAGVDFSGVELGRGGAAALAGVIVGLAAGKPIGILAASWLAVRSGVAALPSGVRWSGVLVVGLVAGIGFTMALFIATLAFPAGPLLGVAKLGILLASGIAAVIGVTAGRCLLPQP
ncbi:MAG TPA: Na+/H+ antiporter NhaA [Polyangia bacterium]